MGMRKTAAIAAIAIAAALSAGCKTLPASFSASKTVDVPALGGETALGDIQYDYKAFAVEDKTFYDPAERGKRIAILTIKPKHLARRIEYDFHDIALTDGTVTKYPAVLRHYYFYNEWETEYGYAVAKDGALKVKFSKTGEHRILLGYVCDEGQKFDKVVFFGGAEAEYDIVNLKKSAPVFEF